MVLLLFPLLWNAGVSATEYLSCSSLPTTGSVSPTSEAIPKYVYTYVHRYGVYISLGIRSWNLIARCYFTAINTHQFSPNYSVLKLWHIVFRKKVLIGLILHLLKPVTRDPQLDSDGEAVCSGSFMKEAASLMIEYYMPLSHRIRERIHQETFMENSFSVINSTKQCHYFFQTDVFFFSCYFLPPVALKRRGVSSFHSPNKSKVIATGEDLFHLTRWSHMWSHSISFMLMAEKSQHVQAPQDSQHWPHHALQDVMAAAVN